MPILNFPGSSIKTPLGNITVKNKDDNAFPGVEILLDGELVAIVEYSSINETLRTIAYTQDIDEPISIVDYTSNEPEVE